MPSFLYIIGKFIINQYLNVTKMLEIFIIPLILLGLYTSYTDITLGKIRNKAILASTIYSLTIYLTITAFFAFNILSANIQFLTETFTNMLSAAALGFFFWYFGLWHAGDGKLFTAYALLIPISIYQIGYLPYFPAFTILVNTFFPVFIFLVINIAFHSSSIKFKLIKESLTPRFMLETLLSIFVMLWPLEYLASKNIYMNFFLIILIYYIVYMVAGKLINDRMLAALIILAIARLMIDKTYHSHNYAIFIFTLFAIFIILRVIILNLGFSSFTKKVLIKDLRPGMILAETIYKEDEKVKKKKKLFFSILSYMLESESIIKEQEGITEDNIKNLKKLSKEHADLKDVYIHETLPFAPFMFTGVLITLFIRGNIIFYLKILIETFI